MPEQDNIWQCPQCETRVDISLFGFYINAECPHCHHRERVHTRCANYRIEGMLGVGGMSLVFRCKDMVLDREVALKLLNDTYRTQDSRIVRFERECAMMARVRHRNVAAIYAAGHENNQFYIAMELVHGKNVEDLLTNGASLPQEQALDIITQVAMGLHAAHQVGLLHRDVKPGNILLTEDGQAKVIDFGLSLQSKETDDEDMIWATPFYVPPETLNREEEDLRTDIYALGMTLRHLLTGSDELEGKPANADDLLAAKQNLKPINKLHKGIHPALAKLVDHMSAFHPAQRPANYEEVLNSMMKCMAELHQKKQFHHYLHSPEFMGRIVLCLTCGFAGAFAAPHLSTYFSQPALLSPARHSEHADWQHYQQLENKIEQGDWVQAQQTALELTSSQDAELSAWSSLLAWCLAELNADENTATDLLNKAKQQLAPLNNELLPSTSLRQDLIALSQWVNDGSQAVLHDKLILSIYQLMLAKQATSTKQDLCLTNAYNTLSKSSLPYKNLSNLVKTRQEKLSKQRQAEQEAEQVAQEKTQAEARYTQWEKKRKSYNFEQLMQECNLALAEDSNLAPPANPKQIRIIQQICQAGTALLDSLEATVWRSLSQKEILTHFAKTDATRYAELQCLCYLLQGQYDEATQHNPHKASTPFSILLKHWVEGLGG